MPLYTHSSNRTENLAQHLAKVIEINKLSVFEKEIFLVQSMGMERWLSQQLATKFGVWANAEFLFPNRFFNNIASLVDSSLQPEVFDRESMVWRFEEAMHDLDGDEFALINDYVSGPQKDVKRLQLAGKLAQVFDQYQILRPQLFVDGLDNAWQQSLWHKVLQQLPAEQRLHRGELWQELVRKLNAASAVSLAQLPKTIHVFGINSLPPLSLEVLKALSKHCAVHLYLLQPCKEYWADAPTKAQAQRDLFTAPDMDAYHPILIRCAQQPKELHEMLVDQQPEDMSYDSYDLGSDGELNALQQLQQDILEGKDKQLQIEPVSGDYSISVHSCHSRMREVQVLKDHLLQRFNQSKELKPREVIVMAPDIGKYEAYIHAVFQNSPIAYSIGDRSLRNQHELLELFIQAIKLTQGRLDWSSVLDLLEHEHILAQLELSDNDLPLVRNWIEQAHIRWAENASHKADLGLPELTQNTWDKGLQEMMLGFAMQGQALDIEGSQAIALGQLDYFMHKVIFAARKNLQHARTLAHWQVTLNKFQTQLFGDKDPEKTAPLTNLLAQLEALPSNNKHSIDVVLEWLNSAVSESKSNSGFLAGQLTFCSMLPMRAIPSKEICLLGMNLGEFPRTDRNPSFDILAQPGQFEKGDRSIRSDDRAQFLEILLSVRDRLYLSYVGRSIKTNDELPPSVLISELQEVVNIKPVEHPLHAFSIHYFNQAEDQNNLFSYDQKAATTASLLQKVKPEPKPWWHTPLSADISKTIDIANVLKFLKNPQEYFCKQVLELHLDQQSEQAPITEPFSLNGLDNYKVDEKVAQWLLDGMDVQTIRANVLESGEYINSGVGELAFDEKITQLQAYVEAVQSYDKGGVKLDNIDLQNIQVGEYTIVGQIPNNYPAIVMQARPSTVKPKDRLQAWATALIAKRKVCLIGLDAKPIEISPPDSELRSQLLTQLITLFVEGHKAPSDLWLDAAWTYVGEKDDEAALGKAIKDLQHKVLGIGQNAYTPTPYNLLITANRSANDILNDNFQQLCHTIMQDCYDREEELGQ